MKIERNHSCIKELKREIGNLESENKKLWSFIKDLE
jgi:hypothetical protein